MIAREEAYLWKVLYGRYELLSRKEFEFLYKLLLFSTSFVSTRLKALNKKKK